MATKNATPPATAGNQQCNTSQLRGNQKCNTAQLRGNQKCNTARNCGQSTMQRGITTQATDNTM
ncbi:hypothetical protein [Aequorivita lipolytica]|uniref:Uncharacterized protein n=1 Tax=Aequorivita lipolytica TaxID=153267 RepID=A0A5C6YT57_9FLAO|nr:hypothetical protein [Aequorivita lipolytica]TXD70576.1 hypothetical protein ESV24_00335 [Aequorivita lipolytica]